MIRRTLLIFCALCAVLLIGCSKTETTNNNNSSAGSAKPGSAASSPGSSTASSSGEKIGVPECDDFIAKYDACVSSKVPEAARAQYKASIAEWRKSWKQLAENPATKATLAAACKQAAEQQAAALKSYGCSF